MLGGELDSWVRRASDLLRHATPSNLRVMPMEDRGWAS
jgi:hypothetical protein